MLHDHGHGRRGHGLDPGLGPGPYLWFVLGPGCDLSRGRHPCREAVSDVVAPGHLFCHHRRESVMAFGVVILLRHGTGEKNEGPCCFGHRTRVLGSRVKNGSWGLESHIETGVGVLEMAHGARTCDAAHVDLTGEGGSLVSAGQHLGGANLAANLSVSLSANKCRGHGGMSESLVEAEERAQKRAAGLDADCCGMASHLHLHSRVTDYDGCCAGICGRRRANRREMEVGGPFRIGDETMKGLDMSQRSRPDCSMSG